MSSKKTKIDTSPERDALTDNPFAALAGAVSPTPSAPEAKAAPVLPAVKYRVPKTRNGNWPIRIEKRAGGKVATLIEPIEGDSAALLSLLKKKLATGGHAKADLIELQGDHRNAVTALFEKHDGAPR